MSWESQKQNRHTCFFYLFWRMLENIPALTTSYGPHCVNSAELKSKDVSRCALQREIVVILRRMFTLWAARVSHRHMHCLTDRSQFQMKVSCRAVILKKHNFKKAQVTTVKIQKLYRIHKRLGFD